jgi:hypothetical protein
MARPSLALAVLVVVVLDPAVRERVRRAIEVPAERPDGLFDEVAEVEREVERPGLTSQGVEVREAGDLVVDQAKELFGVYLILVCLPVLQLDSPLL